MAQKLTMARRCCICEVRPAEGSVGAERVSRKWGASSDARDGEGIAMFVCAVYRQVSFERSLMLWL